MNMLENVRSEMLRYVQTRCHKIIRIDLLNDSFIPIQVADCEWCETECNRSLSAWFVHFISNENVYSEDVVLFESTSNVEKLRDYFDAAETNSCVSIHYRRKIDGTYRWVCMDIIKSLGYNAENKIAMLYVRDIEEQFKPEYDKLKKLEQITTTDSLTGLQSRYSFNQLNIEDECGVIFCDVNGLKLTNDTKGHLHGDKLLANFATFMKSYFPQHNCYRISGDEFIVVLSIAKDEFYNHAERFFDAVNEINPPVAAVGYAFGKLNDALLTSEDRMYKDKQSIYDRFPELRRK